MRFVVVFLFALHFLPAANAQLVNIPDPAFRTYLRSLSALNGCWVGEQLNTQCSGVSAVRTIYPPFRSGVIQLNGIQYFPNLDTLNINQLYNVFELPNLPPRLRYLDCSGNPMPLLPQLPNTLQTLLIEGCGMADLPPLPRGLRHLNCNYNANLAFPPVLPDSLRTLSMFNNNAKQLPPLPASLRTLIVGFNQILTLPALPNQLELLYVHNNPIQCLPRLPESLRQLLVANTQINCLPNRPANLLMQDATLPVCNAPCRTVSSVQDERLANVRVWHHAGVQVGGWPEDQMGQTWHLQLYNVLGQAIHRTALNGDGTYPCSAVPGWYVYQLRDAKGAVAKTGKLWIRE